MKRLASGLFAAVALALAIEACGSGASPSTPAAPTATISVAVVAISSFTATVETTSTGLVYHVAYSLTETSGRSSATLTGIGYALANGTSTDASLNGPVKITPGGTLALGPINVTDNTGRGKSPTVTVTVAFTDDGAEAGSSSATASVADAAPPPGPPVPATYTISGTITDGTSHGMLPNINVELADVASLTRTTKSLATGTFSFGSVSTGSYTVTASAVSYQTTSQAVSVIGDAHVDVVLQRIPSTPPPAPTPPPDPTARTGVLTVTLDSSCASAGATPSGPLASVDYYLDGLLVGVLQIGGSISKTVSIGNHTIEGRAYSPTGTLIFWARTIEVVPARGLSDEFRCDS